MFDLTGNIPTNNSFVDFMADAEYQLHEPQPANTMYHMIFAEEDKGKLAYIARKPEAWSAGFPELPSYPSVEPLVERLQNLPFGRQHQLSYQESLNISLQLVAMEFWKIDEPKISKVKFQLLDQDICASSNVGLTTCWWTWRPQTEIIQEMTEWPTIHPVFIMV